MPVRKIVHAGDPKLYEISKEIIDFNDPALPGIIADMMDSMQHYGGVGIAAPQIGHQLRIIRYGFDNNPRYPDQPALPMQTVINPSFKPLSDEMEPGWEGCLSVPGYRGLVSRYKRIYFSGFNPAGEQLEGELEGFHARVIQHEIDHLDGVVFPMRIEDLRNFGCEREIFARLGITLDNDEL